MDEVGQLANGIGGRMGINFEPDAVAYLHRRYGGHPLLTKKISCSYVHADLARRRVGRPVSISSKKLLDEQSDRESELYFYCKHVVSELQEFYKDEYELLEYLASGNIIEFLEFSSEKTWITHLKSYGIVNVSEAGRPTFAIDVIRQYVAVERAKRLRATELRWVVPQEKRKDYLARRIPNLLLDSKMLLRTIEKCGKIQPYGNSTLPEADLIAKVSVCEKWGDFNSFVTDYYKALVEPIDLKPERGSFIMI